MKATKLAVAVLLTTILVGATACLFAPKISLTANQTSGHPTETHNGYPVKFVVDGVPKTATMDYGDGSLELVSSGTITHTYRKAGTYEATLSLGSQNSTVTIKILNTDPIVYGPSSLKYDSFEWHDKVTFDMRRRTSGCDNGTPQFQYGAYDPDGDSLTYTWNVIEDGGARESIFDTQGRLITNKPTTEEIVVWFAGYKESTTPYPLCSPTPIPDPSKPPQEEYNATLTILVQDGWGGETLYSRRIHVSGSSCKHNR